MRATCPLCRQRKGKRACPALGEAVCAHCCGTKRRVEVHCPADCSFLGGSHAPGWTYRRGEFVRDVTLLAPFLEALSTPSERLFQALLHEAARLGRTLQFMDDRLLLDAVRSLRKTQATQASGIVYEHSPEDARAGAILRELGRYFGAGDQSAHAPDPRDSQAALSAMEGLLESLVRTGEPRAFIGLATRLSARFPAPEPAQADPGLITL
jgi:hypothetical protein